MGSETIDDSIKPSLPPQRYGSLFTISGEQEPGTSHTKPQLTTTNPISVHGDVYWRKIMQNVQQLTTTHSSSVATVSSTKQILAALFIGVSLVLLVGFAPMEVVHNAAHDARHAFAFPCH